MSANGTQSPEPGAHEAVDVTVMPQGRGHDDGAQTPVENQPVIGPLETPSRAQPECAPRVTSEPPTPTEHDENLLPLVDSSLPWNLCQRVLALIGIVILSPMFAVIFVMVKCGSPGPFLFTQVRRGLGGRRFTIYKIRTMRQGSEAKTRLGVSLQSAQITRVGRVLRKTKIDELPQLWNIVLGHMDLVGPRPIPIALEDRLREEIPRFRERNRVKPGISSFSQVVVVDNGIGDQLVDDWTERFEGELHYIQRKSFVYDCVVIAMSGLYVGRMVLGKLLRSRRVAPEAGQTVVHGTNVLGTTIGNVDYEEVVHRVGRWVAEGGSHYIAIAPVHSVIEGVLHRSHRESLTGASLVTADGMPIVWAQKLLGHRRATRVYGPTLMLKTLATAERRGWRVALFGGREERLPMLVDRLKLQFPKLQIVKSISPPFRQLSPAEDAALVDELNAARPDVIFVGLGCPKQERWMFEHSERVPGVMLGVGAAFDFHARFVAVAPPFLQRIGMEWFFRLCCEPRRLFRRYAVTNPIYVGLLCWQLLKRALLFRNYQVAEVVDDGPSATDASTRSASSDETASAR